MSDPAQAAELPQPKENPEALVLRGRPRPAVRFRRGLIVGVTGAVVAGLITLSWLALEPPGFRHAAAPIESGEPAPKGAADALASLPGSYDDVPRLGPPLPGDLGRPILEQQRSLDRARQIPDAAPGADQAQSAAQGERERLAAERQAARSSAVLVQLEGRGSSSAEPDPDTAARGVQSAPPSPPGQAGTPRDAGGDPPPPILSAGTVIPASLLTGIDSGLPGMVLAQVSENVRDSATGRTILIPQGARLIGSYDSRTAYGQRRALVAWARIVFPDGSSIALDNLPASDAAGYSGLEDRVDSHGWRLLKGIAMATLIGVSAELGIGGEGELVRAIREAAGQSAAHAGDRLISRELDVQPTIRVRPGWPVRVLVSKDLILQPWRG